MSHELATHNILDAITGETIKKHSMAYVGDTPWHGLGQQLQVGASMEVWAMQAGMDFTIKMAPVLFYDKDDDEIGNFPERHVLYRSDNRKPLSVMSSAYNIVQPAEILQAQFDLATSLGSIMETAGVLFDGKKFWSLSKLNEGFSIGNDQVNSYILIATSCDGSLATVVKRTSIRVVCNNTLSMAAPGRLEGKKGVLETRVTHNQKFDLDKEKETLGLTDTAAMAEFADHAKTMAKTNMTDKDVIKYFANVLRKQRQQSEIVANLAHAHATTEHGDIMDELLAGTMSATEEEKDVYEMLADTDGRQVKQLYDLYNGGGKGSNMAGSAGTLWGAVNAVTEYNDHHRGARTTDARINRAWFGDGESMKNKAWDDALSIIASL